MVVTDFLGTEGFGVVTPVVEDFAEEIAAESVRNRLLRGSRDQSRAGRRPATISMHAAGPAPSGIGSIAVTIAIFVLAGLDVTNPDAAHEIEGVARDFDVGAVRRLKPDRCRFLRKGLPGQGVIRRMNSARAWAPGAEAVQPAAWQRRVTQSAWQARAGVGNGACAESVDVAADASRTNLRRRYQFSTKPCGRNQYSIHDISRIFLRRCGG